ncbi:hypothetical protein ABGB18_46105 [Nonomuraea sp. B12E4]|uniref:hypothetical protein n=1 Tax=Nonomuraea sp. B12E4 TaxID=3153564 RepID=UPI00325C8455
MPADIWFRRYPRYLEKTVVFANVSLRVRHEGAVVATFRPGRLVWWALAGLLTAEPYAAVLKAGPVALACAAALGLALGLLGCLAALAGAALMATVGGVPFADLSWWTVPLLAGWVAGAMPWPSAEVGIARAFCILAPAAPLAALWVESRSWLAALIMYVLLIRPHFGLVGRTTAGLTRRHRGQIWLGAVIWLLGTTLLALGPAGAWFVRTWPPGLLGAVAGTVCVALAMLVVKVIYLLAGRGSLAKVTLIKAPAGMRLNRDRFSGLYGAELGIAWFCVTAAGIFHYDVYALLGSGFALVLFSTSYAARWIEIPIRHTIDRLDAAHYLFSVGRRREQLQRAWVEELDTALTVMARIRVAIGDLERRRGLAGRRLQRRKARLDHLWVIRAKTALQLVEVMTDESEKTALGDVDDTLWLPFQRAEGRPPLLDVALKWADEALSLLDLAATTYPELLTAREPLRSTFAGYRCYLHGVRGLANRLHGRYEEAVIDYWTTAGLYRQIEAFNAEAISLAVIPTIFPGVDPRRLTGRHPGPRPLPLAEADTAMVRAMVDDRVHNQLRRIMTASAALVRASYGDQHSAERFLRLAAAIPPARPGRTKMGTETIEITETRLQVQVGQHHLNTMLNVVDYGPLLRGAAPVTEYLPTGHMSNPWIIQEILNGRAPIPGLRRLARGLTSSIRPKGMWVDIPDTMVIEKWIEDAEQRGSFAMAAQFHELLGLELRSLDPYPAAGHLVSALSHLQSVHFGIVDEELRGTARGAADAFAELVIDHLATLATQPLPPGVQPEPASLAVFVVRSVKSRALAELLGETVPAPASEEDALMRHEREARARYRDARESGDHQRLREAREELEHCWSELQERDGHDAEYAALRAGLPIEQGRMPALLTQLASPGPSGEATP